jgi:hypothetical protein
LKRSAIKPSSELKRKTPMQRIAIRAIPNTTNSPAKLRARKCKTCWKSFSPERDGQKVCGDLCAELFGKAQSEKQERKSDRARKDAIKTRSDYLKEAQIEFNRYIRARDANLSCISCGRNSGAKINAGHFLSVGSNPQLRFNEKNCHLQCEHCNTYLSGNIHQYRPRLVEKIGLQAVEALESDQAIRKWTIDELKAIKALYRAKLKELKA